MKLYFILFGIVAVLVGIWLFHDRIFSSTQKNEGAGVLQIVVTSAELGSIAQVIGGSHIVTKTINEQERNATNNADVFIFTDNSSETWANALAPGLAKKGIVSIKTRTATNNSISASAGLSPEEELVNRLVQVYSVLDQPHASEYAAAGQRYRMNQK